MDYVAILADLEIEISKLRQVLRDAEASQRFYSRLNSKSPRIIRTKKNGNTVPKVVANVIARTGRPMGAAEIARILSNDGLDSPLPISITSAMRRRTDLFQKVSRGLYELRPGAMIETQTSDSPTPSQIEE